MSWSPGAFGVLAAGLLSLLPLPLRAGDGADWPALVALFEQRGLKVVLDHPRCQEAGLFGLYERSQRRVVVCPRGDRRDTLRHEGWHAIQALCLREAPLLPREVMDRGLTARDRRDLDRLYGPSRWNHEAEARVMARLSLANYRIWLDAACGPLEESPPDQPAARGLRPSPSAPSPGAGGRPTSAPGGGP